MWGEGDETVVAVPPLAQNIEVAWESPHVTRMLERFGSFSRYLHFDKRGTGASDRRSRVPGIDERVEDLRAVMDSADIDSAHLFAQSDGGPMTLLFAATYPDRVESLILFGTGATLRPTWPEEVRVEARERQVREWGTPESRIVDGFAPSLAADQEFRSWHQRYERQAATTDSLRELLDLSAEMDATEVLSTLDVPTLILHRTDDRIVPVELGRELAAAIPGARLVELAGDDHFAYAGDLDLWMAEMEEFVTGQVRSREHVGRRADPVRIRTLGGFAVEVDGEAVPTSDWGSRHARQLCKRLVAARGWPVTRDELVDLLWPDESGWTRLSARLSVQLSIVRRVLGGGIIADRQMVRLDLDEVSTDLEDLYKASDDRAIVAAYPGEFLPEDRYEDWTSGPRDEARSRYVAAARRVAQREQSLGNPLRAAGFARRLVGIDPYDEASHRLLVESLLAAGETSEARTAHEAWSAAMSDIGVEATPFETMATPSS
jgi:pimeloyl-ACP methyl ester carboxylesterase/DNA-binding SARP family transcriptional activator